MKLEIRAKFILRVTLLEGEMWKSNVPKRPGNTPVAPGLVPWPSFFEFIQIVSAERSFIEPNEFFFRFFVFFFE